MDYVKLVVSLAYYFLGKMMCGYVATELCLGYSETVKYKYSSMRGLTSAKRLQKRERGGGKHGYGTTDTQRALQGRQKEKEVYAGQAGGLRYTKAKIKAPKVCRDLGKINLPIICVKTAIWPSEGLCWRVNYFEGRCISLHLDYVLKRTRQDKLQRSGTAMCLIQRLKGR